MGVKRLEVTVNYSLCVASAQLAVRNRTGSAQLLCSYWCVSSTPELGRECEANDGELNYSGSVLAWKAFNGLLNFHHGFSRSRAAGAWQSDPNLMAKGFDLQYLFPAPSPSPDALDMRC